MAINPHHLELFHYVVRHGGIAQASKNMPYGVGQSAISLQITRLESHLGVTLFQRRPFRLTPEGAKLHAQADPFFRALERIETEFRGGVAPLLRIGATEIIQRDHLPAVFNMMRKERPDLRFAIRDADPVSLAALVRAGELDAAVCLYSDKPPADLIAAPLLAVRPVLAVPANHPAKSAADILDRERMTAPLVCLPPAEPVSMAFQTLLAKQGRVWEPSLELGSLPLIHMYVKEGYGVGLTVAEPGLPVPEGLRLLPLPDAPPLTVTVIHNGRPNPLRDMLLAVASAHAGALVAASAPGPDKSAKSGGGRGAGDGNPARRRA